MMKNIEVKNSREEKLVAATIKRELIKIEEGKKKKDLDNFRYNLSARSYTLRNFFRLRLKSRREKNKKNKIIKNFLKKSDHNMSKYNPYLHDIRFGFIFIKSKKKNAFMTLTNRKMRIVTVKSIGAIKTSDMTSFLYKGKEKISAVAKTKLGSLVSIVAWQKHLRIIDVMIPTRRKLKWFYHPFLKGLRKRAILIRRIFYKNMRPHGYVRKCNKRRI